MPQPPLLELGSVAECRNHYLNCYVRSVVTDRHGMRVYFSPERFDHAFYEFPRRDGGKEEFSAVRAQRMDWIAPTLNAPEAV